MKKPIGALTLSAAQLGERLGHDLTLTDWRAVIAVVVAAPGLEDEAERVCAKVVAKLGLDDSRVTHWVVRRDAGGRERLSAINRARDQLLKDKRLIWLRAGSATDVRFLRRHAPDLTAAIDLFAELRAEVVATPSWDFVREQLCALMEQRNATLDFTGLLPANVEQTQLPLAELYQPLVEKSRLQLLLEPEARAGSLLVLGHPGTGKTTYLRHLAWTYARQEADPLEIGAKVPLLLSLSDYGYEREHDRVRSLVDFLPGWLQQQGVEDGAVVVEHLPDVLLLLDGLDEMRTPEARRALLGEVRQLQADDRLGGVVVSGRSFLVDEVRPQDHGLQIVNTRAPEQAEIRSFLTTFVELRRGSSKHVKDLIGRIENDPDLKGLTQTPLMLAFMAILDELEGRLPDRRIEIYYRLGEMLVDRWTRARSIGTSSHQHERPTRADALRVLGPLAWWTVERGGGAIPEDELFRELVRIESKRRATPEAEQRARAMLELLRCDTALLVPQPGRRWSFVHASIGEYFAGVEAERDRQRWSALLEDPFRTEWREILLFCAGQLGVIEGRVDSLDSLVSAVLAKSRRAGRNDAKYPSLLIGLLQESPGLSRPQIEQLVASLLELMLTNEFSDDAARQTYIGFSRLSHSSRGVVAEQLGVGLRLWFSERTSKHRWDRALDNRNSGLPGRLWATWYADLSSGELAWIVIPGVIGILESNESIRFHDIDLGPTLARWAQQPNWRYRFAEWIVRNDREAQSRPFGEVFQELGIT